MSRKDKSISKLIASLGVFGLVICFCAPRVSAQVPAGTFTAANYSGRYVCSASTGTLSDTAVMKLKPNGAGAYTATSSLSANDGQFSGDGTANCNYTLGTGSAYTVSGDGTGFEMLNWTASAANPTVCPASFTDLRAIALRNLTNINGVVINVEFSSDNLLGQANAGWGLCLK
jgi:hypothetical protein